MKYNKKFMKKVNKAENLKKSINFLNILDHETIRRWEEEAHINVLNKLEEIKQRKQMRNDE